MKKIAPILFGVAFTAILLWAIFTFEFVSWDFRNNLWAPARLVLAGFYMAGVILSMLTLQSTAGLDDALWYVPLLLVFGVLAANTIDHPGSLRG